MTNMMVGPPADPKDTADLIGHPQIPDPNPEEITDPGDPNYVEADPEATEPDES